jgi:murein tripeptide amidase MpaA
MRLRNCISIFTCLVLLTAAHLGAQDKSSDTSQLLTVAEATKYQATAKGADVELFLKRLQRQWAGTKLESIGKTVEGRDIWALVVPPRVESTSVINVLLLGGIHSGECDGKEALLALARDYATGKQPDIRQNVRMIFVPNFNADGNERVGLLHRPGQDGPAAGMGIRENAQGLLRRPWINGCERRYCRRSTRT